MLTPISADYADALIAEETARIRAMTGLVPYPIKIGALEGLAERCTSALKGASLHSIPCAGACVPATMSRSS